MTTTELLPAQSVATRIHPVPGGCDLWLLAESDVDEVAARLDASSALSPLETERLQRLLRPDSRRRHLGARVLARWAVGRYLGQRPRDVRFAVGEYGRPLLIDGGHLDFNLTHTDGLIACAVTTGATVGLDVETFPARAEAGRLITRVLTARELEHIECTNQRGVREALAEHWVLKEAYTKALGLGLHHAFDSFDIRDLKGRPRVHDPKTAAMPLPDWSLHLLHLGRAYVMGLARSDRRHGTVLPLRLFDAAGTLAGVETATAALVPRAVAGVAVARVSVSGQAVVSHLQTLEAPAHPD
ncbi:4'-phosphopantetheinyl transferase family protein [Flexivirga oryzae]|uniref:4'-phosphopantetheinyl transferase n=1 Tax=Flexivirga oryzae TaxID=1794944 RepID=A0A839N659_9MICO|nr:4'-phosphopantetheinyl transferase superfamily protein [Flexivirga oryzae]MBB2893238.1 4'-phosphopantetheinyl transferase [Flexivirga oryzae]